VAQTFRTLVESEDYLDQLEKIAAAKNVDEALRALLWSLSVRPEVWPLVPGFSRLRIAWTDSPGGPVITRGLQIWFEIRDANYVDLLYLDYVDEED
jgi:hypothetical protein